MKPHNKAALGVGKLTVLVLALIMGAGMAGAFGDGKAAPDFSTRISTPTFGGRNSTGPLRHLATSCRPTRSGLALEISLASSRERTPTLVAAGSQSCSTRTANLSFKAGP